MASTVRAATVLLAVGALLLSLPMPAFAHGLLGRVESPLPLAVYLTGAALAVGLSFAFVLVRNVEAPSPVLGPPRHVPRALALFLRAVGLIGWAWIVAQTLVGGSSAAEVATLFLWVYGWVAIAMLSALVGPVWHFIDPFSTLFDLGAGILRALKVETWQRVAYPAWLGRWPAVAAYLVVVWLELGLKAGSSSLGVVLIGYTALTLAMMAQFGRDTWRANGEVFSVWFSLLGRLAPFDPVDPAGRVRRRPYVSGLLTRGWTLPEVAIVSFGVGSILFDGLSQTAWWFGLFGLPGLGMATLQLVLFLGLVLVCVLGVARLVGLDATGAGLVPIAVGYLIAHYLTFLLGEGQRLIVAISDPFQLGWDLFGTAFFEPGTDWIPPSLMWTVQLAAVVGGHIVGAWAGHVVAAREVRPGTDVRLRQLPLAILMVALTATTLWSLGQTIVREPTGAMIVRSGDPS